MATVETSRSLKDNLEKKIKGIRSHVSAFWNDHPPPVYFTDHGPDHSQRIENRLKELLGEDYESLLPYEEFVLNAAAWLHDVGMAPDLFDGDPKPTPDDHDGKPIFDPAWLGEVRFKHHERSEQYVMDNQSMLGLDNEEAESIALVCRWHRRTEKLPPPKNDKDKLPLLAAYLRLADALDITDSARAPRDKYEANISMGTYPDSTFHWLKSMFAAGMNPQRDKFAIEVLIKKPRKFVGNMEHIKSLGQVLCEEIQDELDSVRDTLAEGGLPLYVTVYSENVDVPFAREDMPRFNALIADLHTRTRWAPNASMAFDLVLESIRWLIENANDKEVDLQQLNDNILIAHFLKERPCHVLVRGLSFLLGETLGRPNPDFNRLNAILDELEKRRGRTRELLSKKTKPFLLDGKPLLLYGYSSSVVQALSEIGESAKERMKLYICEGRPKTAYRYNNRLLYCDGVAYAEKLKEDLRKGYDTIKGFKKENLILIPDIAVANLMARGKISKVFFGANGVDVDGNVYHGLGHRSIADIAGAYRVPVYVIAESAKIAKFNGDQVLERTEPWLTTDTSFDLGGVELCNPREDRVPADKITSILTERGAFIPKNVRQLFPSDTSELPFFEELFRSIP